MALNPLGLSEPFSTAQCLDVIGQSIKAPASIPFVVAAYLVQIPCNTPLALPLWIPSQIASYLSKTTQLSPNYFAWIAPAMGMPLLTLAGRVAFDLTANPFLKGAVYGIHTFAMGLITNTPSTWSELIGLRQVISNFMGLQSAMGQLTDANRVRTLGISEYLSSAAFLTASLGLSFFGGFHVITANATGYAVAAVVAAVSARTLAYFGEKKPQEPLRALPTQLVAD